MVDVNDGSVYIGIELSEHLCFKFDSLFHGAKTIPIIHPPLTSNLRNKKYGCVGTAATS